MSDAPRQDGHDPARPSATRYSLTLDEVARRFDQAGLPRNTRSLQRYCAAGRLDCIKEETITGLAYFVEPDSVDRAITELAQLHGLTEEVRQSPTLTDTSHHVAPEIATPKEIDTPRPSAAERDSESKETLERQSAPQPDMSGTVAALERENASLHGQNDFLLRQIDVKDTQIAALLERDKETNYLVRGLQTMLAPLLGRGSEEADRQNVDRGDNARS